MPAMSDQRPLVTVAVPSLNHGRFLDCALRSIFAAGVPAEVMVLDAGSTDETGQVIDAWRPRLAYWRSSPDAGQAAAINEGIARGTAPYVAWLNADDAYAADGLAHLLRALVALPGAPAVYGRAHIVDAREDVVGEYRTGAFDRGSFARRCFICQPATLVRRTAWEALGGVDESMSMAFDYDLWWRLAVGHGELGFVDRVVAQTRAHVDTKTVRFPFKHYAEAMSTVARHYGRVPPWWYVKMPFSIGHRLVRPWLSRAIGPRQPSLKAPVP
jgi:glycosyltransferase involved in cell wall biosynthesis